LRNQKKRHYNATHFFGFQTVATFIGFFMLYFVLALICFIVAFTTIIVDVRNFVLNLAIPTFLAFLAISYPILLIESYIITEKDGKELKQNFLYYFADCFYLTLHLLRGLILIPVRALLGLLLHCLFFARLDVYMFPAELRVFDWASTAYNGMVYMEHKYNNPLAIVFREFMLREIKLLNKYDPQQHAKRQLQIKIQQAILLTKNSPLQRQNKTYIVAVKAEKLDFIRRARGQLLQQRQSALSLLQ